MTSQQTIEIAAPAWGRGARAARAPALREVRRPGPAPVLPARPLELRVRGAGLGAAAVGIALAAGFTLLWVFLLLGVVGPAGALG